ncbi:uncharacterized protein LOC121191502 [Toxotes jaculatrix]|uniref:uncharacterized protein LOC121191502 n=1 Tax=Toxotes jaculatrix TaxID=941984 RepID=UPI001B3B1A8F|nr:uncharacterized protein LOC121191502 [Toxotes jaculatrix]
MRWGETSVEIGPAGSGERDRLDTSFDTGTLIGICHSDHKRTKTKNKAVTEDREAEIQPQLQKVTPGDWVYVKVFKRKWDQPRREGPFKVTLATPTALQVQVGKTWLIGGSALNICPPQSVKKNPNLVPVNRSKASARNCQHHGQTHSHLLHIANHNGTSSGLGSSPWSHRSHLRQELRQMGPLAAPPHRRPLVAHGLLLGQPHAAHPI